MTELDFETVYHAVDVAVTNAISYGALQPDGEIVRCLEDSFAAAVTEGVRQAIVELGNEGKLVIKVSDSVT